MYKHGLSLTGEVVERSSLSSTCEGHKLLAYDFTQRYGGVSFLSSGSWVVSDFVELPEKYLKGINSE